MTPRKRPLPTARRITACELRTLTFCQRASFLEGQPTALAGRARPRRHRSRHPRERRSSGQKTARAARLLLILGLVALLCTLSLGWLRW
jgi:hypothetical protein